MKKVGALVILALVVIACNQPTQKESKEQPQTQTTVEETPAKDGVFIHITEGYEDPHRVLMPLKMATMMAKDKDVLVYMDIHAVELVAKEAKDLEYADFESAHTYIRQLVNSNVGVYACPTCLKIAGINPEDLIEGVQTAEKDKFFNFTEGRIITLDY